MRTLKEIKNDLDIAYKGIVYIVCNLDLIPTTQTMCHFIDLAIEYRDAGGEVPTIYKDLIDKYYELYW